MNSKMIAIAAVAVLIASGAALVLAVPSDAEGTGTSGSPVDLGTVILYDDKSKSNDSTTAKLKFNETAYLMYTKYTVKMSVADGTSNTAANDNYSGVIYDSEEEGKTATVKGLEISASKVSGQDVKAGCYEISIGDTIDTKDGSVTIFIKLDVTVQPKEDESLTISLDPFYYELKVDVRTIGEITFTNGTNDSPFEFVEDVANEYILDVSSPSSLDSIAYWYAIDLPGGLNIGTDGTGNLKIYGMATKATSGNAEVKVVGRDSSGNEYVGTVYVKVSSANQSEITIALYSGDELLTPNNDNYVVESDETDLTLKIKGVTTNDGVVVSVLNKTTGVREVVSGQYNDNTTTMNYDIPVNGVGTYVIEVHTNSSTDEDKSFVLYVVPAVTGSDAGFVIIPTGS